MEKRKGELTPEQLQQQISERATYHEPKAYEIERKFPQFAQGTVHKLFDRLDLYRPQVGYDQDVIPLGYQPQKFSHFLITQGIIAFAHPRVIEQRKDKDVVGQTNDHLGKGGKVVAVSNHLANADGPELTKVTKKWLNRQVTSPLGKRLYDNPWTRRMLQGVPIIPVYPDSEKYWTKDAYKVIEESLTPEQLAMVERDKRLSAKMLRESAKAIKDELKAGHPILLFLEGTRNPKGGLQKPVAATASVIGLGGKDTKVLVMGLMGTEKMLPKREKKSSETAPPRGLERFKPKVIFQRYDGPRPAKVTDRFIDLLDPNEIKADYKKTHPKAESKELDQHLLTEIMKTIAAGVEPSYRGIYADMVTKEFEFIPLIDPKDKYHDSVQRLISRAPSISYFLKWYTKSR